MTLLWSQQAMAQAASTSTERLSIKRIYSEPNFSGAAPRGLQVAPDGQRITFLRGQAGASERLDLWEYHIASKKTRVLVKADELTGGKEQLSAEERARRERMRMASLSGIIEYYFSNDGQQLLFPLSGALYRYDLNSKTVSQLTKSDEGAVSDVRFSPKANFVSFVRGQNLYVIDLKSNKTTAMSSDGGGAIANGVAEFVAQEEMARFTGYWWAPDESMIAMQRYDESSVPIAKRFEIYADRTEVIEQRYPAAGTTNVRTQLFVVPVRAASQRIEVDLGSNPDIYLARVDWLPDSKRLAVQIQSRDQRQLQVQLADASTGKSTNWINEQSSTYVNLHDDLHFLAKAPQAIWASESGQGGFKHLQLYDLSGKKLRDLTSGAFVVDDLLAVDEANDRIFFAANKGDVNQKHIFSTSISGKTGIQQLSTGEGTHNAVFAKDASVYVDTYSDWNTPPQVRLFNAKGSQLTILEANTVDAKHPYFAFAKQASKPEFGTLQNDGATLYYRLLKPRDFDPSKRYPALVYTYGGPHVQVLQRQWDARWGQLLQYFASQGYVVFCLDNRGSARRGRDFESAIYGKMGGPDVADQLAGIKWLGSQAFIDSKRIGIFGWSYGGYMSAHVLAQGGDLLRAGAVGAPVTDWAKYDTHYTERYMDLPARNAEGYKNSTVMAHLPSLKATMLLIHGMADDNVLFTNSTALMSALQQRGVGFDLMTYPGMKHGPADNATRIHVFEGIARFFARELRPGE